MVVSAGMAHMESVWLNEEDVLDRIKRKIEIHNHSDDSKELKMESTITYH